jgi:hypothetical protein
LHFLPKNTGDDISWPASRKPDNQPNGPPLLRTCRLKLRAQAKTRKRGGAKGSAGERVGHGLPSGLERVLLYEANSSPLEFRRSSQPSAHRRQPGIQAVTPGYLCDFCIIFVQLSFLAPVMPLNAPSSLGGQPPHGWHIICCLPRHPGGLNPVFSVKVFKLSAAFVEWRHA